MKGELIRVACSSQMRPPRADRPCPARVEAGSRSGSNGWESRRLSGWASG